MSTIQLTAGFLPLFDSVLLVLAAEKGFAEDEGITLKLIKENSWASIRDRAAIGHFEVAQMLAPMPIAASLGLTPIATPTIAPVVLGLGNNAITVSKWLWSAMAGAGALSDLDPVRTGQALARVVHDMPRKLRFGVVHQTSSHNYELRYWLAASGIRPDKDIEIVVLPPPLLPDAMGAGGIDGYCVGEPWNSVGVAQSGGHIATVKALIWQSSPDKVLGMREQWANEHPELVSAIIRAIYRAGLWCADPANHAETAAIMASPAYLGHSREQVERALSGVLAIGADQVRNVPDFYIPHASAANFPWKSHALWYYSQMVRWGEVAALPEHAARAAATFRPDLYRSALALLDTAIPSQDFKIDGLRATPGELPAKNGALLMSPDLFFDGRVFDPDQLEGYIQSQKQQEASK